MFNDNLLYDLNLRYLSVAKDLALTDPKLAQLKLGLSEFLISIIANSSFQQLNRMAKQKAIYFHFLPNEELFARLLDDPDNELLQVSLVVSSNLAVFRANQ